MTVVDTTDNFKRARPVVVRQKLEYGPTTSMELIWPKTFKVADHGMVDTYRDTGSARSGFVFSHKTKRFFVRGVLIIAVSLIASILAVVGETRLLAVFSAILLLIGSLSVARAVEMANVERTKCD